MSRLTLRLPETLHQKLERLARRESVSLHQYILDALKRQAASAYTVQPVSGEEATRQQAAYTTLLQSLGRTTFSEIEKALAEREKVKPEKGLTPEVVKALKGRMARQRASA